MKFRDMIAMAVGSLFKRKVRTFLTVAGVVIGTCAIVVMLSLGFGLRQSMENALKQMGDLTVITIYNGNGGGPSESGSQSSLDDRALKKISEIPNVTAVTPIYYLSPSVVNVTCRKKYQFQGMIYGVAMDSLKEFGYQAADGSLPKKDSAVEEILFGSDSAYDFIDTQKKHNRRISRRPDKNGNLPKAYVDLMEDKFSLAVNTSSDSGQGTKGIDIAETDGGTTSASKQKAVRLSVAGVLAEDYSKNPQPSDCIFMDISYAKKLQAKYNKLNKIKKDSKNQGYDTACVKVSSIDKVSEAQESIKNMGFEVYSMETQRSAEEKQIRTVQMILGGLGAVSLLVAALGITNTMIMSIYERTREIGIMKVLGCVVRNIRTMFLIEAGAIGFLGGVAGTGISYGFSVLINHIAAQHMGSAGAEAAVEAGEAAAQTAIQISIIPPWLAVGAVLFATAVGLLSGLYPANRAVKISALTAIKQE